MNTYTENQDQPLDALADVMKTIHLRATTYFCSDFISPWGMDIQHSPEGSFHIVVKGHCWLKVGMDDDLIALETGDIVAFPTGGAHWLSDHKNSARLPGEKVLEQVLSGNNPFKGSPLINPLMSSDENLPSSTILCGSFSYDSAINHPFLKNLPCFIHIKAKETQELDWLRSLVTVLSNESRTPAPGSTVMVERLTEILFIQLLRTYIKQAPKKMGYLAALADPQIGTALNLIHAEQTAYWNVERLGEKVAMSRTSFTEKFTKLVGMPPKNYLVNGRMQKAKRQLEIGNMVMIEIAEAAGYSSEAAFSKAFKQFFDITPGKIRRQN